MHYQCRASFLPCLLPQNSPEEERIVSQTNAKNQMPRRLVWIDETRRRAFGCSECAWVFDPFGSVTGNSLNEAMQNFEVWRDREFSSHVCADHPRTVGAKHPI